MVILIARLQFLDQDDKVSTTNDSDFLDVPNKRKDLMAKLSHTGNLLLDESQMVKEFPLKIKNHNTIFQIISSSSLETPSNLSHSIGLFTLIEPVLSSIRNMDLE